MARLGILNTGIGACRAPSPEWVRSREFIRWVGTEIVPGQLVRISCVSDLDDDVVEAYKAPLPDPGVQGGVLLPGAGAAEIVAGAGHFLQEEKGEEIAERIVRFISDS